MRRERLVHIRLKHAVEVIRHPVMEIVTQHQIYLSRPIPSFTS